TPEIDCGRAPIKRVVGDAVSVEADLVCDGHDLVDGVVCYRPAGAATWSEVPMALLDNDRFQASFVVPALGRYFYTIEAWVDRYATQVRHLARKVEAGQGELGADIEVLALQIE